MEHRRRVRIGYSHYIAGESRVGRTREQAGRVGLGATPGRRAWSEKDVRLRGDQGGSKTCTYGPATIRREPIVGMK